jgi:acetyl-CoA carboxylase biotin carboxyl carrier protein
VSRALTAERGDDRLLSPSVGTWTPALSLGAVVRPGAVLGGLTRVGRLWPVLAPDGAEVQVAVVRARGPVMYGDVLYELGQTELTAGQKDGLSDLGPTATSPAVRAPMAGTLYRRAAPDQPELAAQGLAVRGLTTVALIEVMKTFTPLHAGAEGVIERWVARDGAGVEAGEVLAWVRPSSS